MLLLPHSRRTATSTSLTFLPSASEALPLLRTLTSLSSFPYSFNVVARLTAEVVTVERLRWPTDCWSTPDAYPLKGINSVK